MRTVNELKNMGWCILRRTRHARVARWEAALDPLLTARTMRKATRESNVVPKEIHPMFFSALECLMMWWMGKIRVDGRWGQGLNPFLRTFFTDLHIIPCKTVPPPYIPYIYPLLDASGPVRVLAIRRSEMNTTSLAFANGEDMANLASIMLVGHESMYVAVFKGRRVSVHLFISTGI